MMLFSLLEQSLQIVTSLVVFLIFKGDPVISKLLVIYSYYL